MNGLRGLAVHDDGESKSEDAEFTLFHLLLVRNCLSRKWRDRCCKKLFDDLDLTEKAKKYFESRKQRTISLDYKNTEWFLAKIIISWNWKHYTQLILKRPRGKGSKKITAVDDIYHDSGWNDGHENVMRHWTDSDLNLSDFMQDRCYVNTLDYFCDDIAKCISV
jgi:hypothetical protein